MGCDIHLFVETKSYNEWWILAELTISRNYRLFAHMAGVRGEGIITPVVEPRGFPEDAGYRLKSDYKTWGEDAHTASWLTFEEFYSAVGKAGQPDDAVAVAAMLASLQKCGVESRVVFWFDN